MNFNQIFDFKLKNGSNQKYTIIPKMTLLSHLYFFGANWYQPLEFLNDGISFSFKGFIGINSSSSSFGLSFFSNLAASFRIVTASIISDSASRSWRAFSWFLMGDTIPTVGAVVVMGMVDPNKFVGCEAVISGVEVVTETEMGGFKPVVVDVVELLVIAIPFTANTGFWSWNEKYKLITIKIHQWLICPRADYRMKIYFLAKTKTRSSYCFDTSVGIGNQNRYWKFE